MSFGNFASAENPRFSIKLQVETAESMEFDILA